MKSKTTTAQNERLVIAENILKQAIAAALYRFLESQEETCRAQAVQIRKLAPGTAMWFVKYRLLLGKHAN